MTQLVLLESDHQILSNMREKMKSYGLKKQRPERAESLVKMITSDITKSLSNIEETGAKEKVFLLLTGVFESINCENLTIFSVAGEKNRTGFIKILSIPDSEIDQHLVLYSSIYGTIFISREKIENVEDWISGDYFCAFDEIPAVIAVGTCKGKRVRLIEKMIEKEEDKYLSELTANLATMIFETWRESKLCTPTDRFKIQFVGETVIEA